MHIYISERFYRALAKDRVSANDLFTQLVKMMQKEIGKPVATVWAYYNKRKVIVADTTVFSGIKVKFLEL